MGLIENTMARRGSVAKPHRSRRKSGALGVQPNNDRPVLQVVERDEELLFTNRLICEKQDRAVTNAYKILRTQVMHRLRANQWTTVGVIAARGGEGKSLTAINLAISLAHHPDQFVTLIDLDLQRPSVSEYTGIEVEKGLPELFNGEDLDDVMVEFGEASRLWVIPNRVSFSDSSEHLGGPQVDALASEVRSRGGVVIYDLPPILETDDYLMFSRNLDCSLFVVSEGRTARDEVARARTILEESNVPCLGVLLNNSTQAGIAGSYYL